MQDRRTDHLDTTEIEISDKRKNRIMNALESIATSLYVQNLLALERELDGDQVAAANGLREYYGERAYQVLLDDGYLGPENVDREITDQP